MPGVYNAGGPVARTVLVDPVTLQDYSAGGGAGGTQVQGPVASGAANTANPEKIAGVYNTTLPSPANGQVVDAQSDERGNLRFRQVLTLVAGTDGWANSGLGRPLASINGTSEVVPQSAGMVFNGTTWDRQRGDASGTVSQPYALTGARFQYVSPTGGLTDTADAQVAPAGAAGVRNYLTGLQFANTGVASEIVVKDGATVIWRGYVPATTGTQSQVTFQVPLKGTAATAMNVAMVTTGAACRVSAQGFTGA